MTAADEWTTRACRIVERSLGKTPTVARHIPVGHSNSVVQVGVDDGQSFAVRMSKLGSSRFDMEAAAMRIAAGVGVPVPTVRFIGSTGDPGAPGAVMITDWVDAPSLASIDRGDAAGRTEVADALAGVLAAIHSCPVQGFGNLDADLCGRAEDFVDWFVTGAAEKVEGSIEVIARFATDGADLARRAVDVLGREAHLFDGAAENLVHGDFSPSNLLVDGTNVAAVIDWESAKGGPPALDLGWLAYIDTDAMIDQERLIQSYCDATGHDVAVLGAASRLVELRILATMAEWQARAGLEAEIPRTLQRLADMLRHP